jgi:hypothetical protein
MKSHKIDVETLARGIHIPEACTRERGGCSTIDGLTSLDPGGSFLSPSKLALEGP